MDSPANRLLLLDTLGMAYRAFHAIKGLATADGRPTNALYGIARHWTALRRVWEPTHAAAVFDGGLPEARRALLPGYKAHRPPMPELLRRQLPWIEEYQRAAGLPCLRVEGEEADDVMAALAQRASALGWDVLIATSDKDLFQTVSKHIRVLPLVRDAVPMGPDDVIRRTGVRPDQIVDFLALTGDAADGIDGVPGVGAKTAARWISEHGSVTALLKQPDALQPARLGQQLRDHQVTVLRNRDLIRLRDPEGLPELPALALRPADLRSLHAFLDRFELHSLKEEARSLIER